MDPFHHSPTGTGARLAMFRIPYYHSPTRTEVLSAPSGILFIIEGASLVDRTLFNAGLALPFFVIPESFTLPEHKQMLIYNATPQFTIREHHKTLWAKIRQSHITIVAAPKMPYVIQKILISQN